MASGFEARARRRAASAAMAAALLALCGCRSASDDPRVAIALLEDRRVARPEAWERYLTRGDDEVRARAARAVGRVRDPALEPALLRALDVEHDVSAKEEQLFALGQIGAGEALGVLLAQLAGDEPVLRAAAAEAIGKLPVRSAAPNLVAHLVDPAPAVRGAAMLALARLVGRRSSTAGAVERGGAALDPDSRTVFTQVVPSLLDDPDEGVRWKTAYALAEIEIEGRTELLAKAAGSKEATVRFFAVSGLARLKSKEPVRTERLTIALGDDDPAIAALAASGLGRTQEGAAFEGLMRAARRDRSPDDFHVRRAALAALADVAMATGEGALDPQQTASVARLAAELREDPSRSVRGEAMSVQARLGGKDAVAAIAAIAFSAPNMHERVAAVRALGRAEAALAETWLGALALSKDVHLASEALSALAALTPLPKEALVIARRAAASSDLAVVGSALELLKVAGSKADLPLVAAAFDRLPGFDLAETRATAVHVGAALAGADAADLLRRARIDPSPAVVAAAVEESRKLGVATDPAQPGRDAWRPGRELEEGGPPSSIELEPGADWLSRAPNPKVSLRFDRGVVVIELLREEAPRHVKMMLERVRAGACDGLPIHRVVTGFVVQGLDPRGDGWGSGGVFLRDEIQRVPFERGSVGMPNAGPDSGGCQIFVTVVPTPHLDGRYTVFGRVVSGIDVVDALDLGDACRKAEVIR